MKDYTSVGSPRALGSKHGFSRRYRPGSLFFGLALTVAAVPAGADSLRTMVDVTQPRSPRSMFEPAQTLSSEEMQNLITLAAPQRLVGMDAAAGDYDGSSVAVDGDTAVVAAPYAAPMGRTDAGAVYVFVRNGTTWIQQTKLVASDGRNGDHFGTRVALSGDTLIVGAPNASSFGRMNCGAAYVFQRSGTRWDQQGKLLAMDGATDDQFGFAVALDGDSAVVGSRAADIGMRKDAGAAYVFSRRGIGWFSQGKLVASDGGVNDSFGVGVAISGDTVLIGADFADIAGKADAGAAYLFQRGAMGWSQQSKLTASDGQSGDLYGRQVALDGNTAAISAMYGDALGKANTGAVYVYSKAATGWSQQAKLSASDGQSNDWFGYEVALHGEQMVVGAPYADVMMLADAGAGYSFVRSGSSWTQSNKLVASDPSPSGFFGNGASLDNDTFLVGAPGRPPGGAAYAFIDRKGNGEACLSATDCGSGFCVDGVCCNNACGGGSPDCQACSVAAGSMANGSCGPARSGTICREASGSCDQAETCSGNSISCPVDVRKPRGSSCRPASHGCDAEEQCDGTSAVCPADASREDGARCELGSCQLGQCRAESDLALQWEAAGATVSGFAPSDLALTLSNKGHSAAFDVMVTIDSPARTALSVAQLPGWSCTSGSAVIHCLVATIPVGDTRLSVSLVPPPALREFDVTARVTSLSTDPDDKNNQATLHVLNDNPIFDQLSGGGQGCAIGGRESPMGATGRAPLAALAIFCGLLIYRRKRLS